MGKILLKAFIVLTIFSFKCIGQNSATISLAGFITFPSATLILTEAGENFSGTITSSQNVFLTISHTNGSKRKFGNFNWRVAVSKTDVFWNSAFSLQVRRAGDGLPGSQSNNNINGGTNFQILQP